MSWIACSSVLFIADDLSCRLEKEVPLFLSKAHPTVS